MENSISEVAKANTARAIMQLLWVEVISEISELVSKEDHISDHLSREECVEWLEDITSGQYILTWQSNFDRVGPALTDGYYLPV